MPKASDDQLFIFVDEHAFRAKINVYRPLVVNMLHTRYSIGEPL